MESAKDNFNLLVAVCLKAAVRVDESVKFK